MSSAPCLVPSLSTNDLSFFYAKLRDSLDANTKVKILKITTSLLPIEGDRKCFEKRKYRYVPLERDIPDDMGELYKIFLEESAELSASERSDPKIQLLLGLLKKPYESREVQLFLQQVKENHLEEKQNPFSYLKERVTDGLLSLYAELPTGCVESVSMRVHFYKISKPDQILTISYLGKPSIEDV
jgi:hypothetical protein